MSDQIDSIEERLAKLERQIGELENAVITKQLVVVDTANEQRAVISADRDSAGLVIYDRHGQQRAKIGAGVEASFVNLLDEYETSRVAVIAGGKISVIHLSDENGISHTTLGANEDSPSLALYDKDAGPCAILALSVNGGSMLLLKDAEGRSIAKIVATGSETKLDICVPEEDLRASLGVTHEGSQMTLLDESGNQTWTTNKS